MLVCLVKFLAFAEILVCLVEFLTLAEILVFFVEFLAFVKVLVCLIEFFAFAKVLVCLDKFLTFAKVLVCLDKFLALVKEFLFPEFIAAKIIFSVKIVIYTERLCNFPHIFMRFFFFPLQRPLRRFRRFFFLRRDHAFDLIDQPLDIRRQDRLCCFLSLHIIPCHFPF